MPPHSNPFVPVGLSRMTALGVFVFFAAMFVLPSGYSYGGGLLLLASFWMLSQRQPLGLSSADRALGWTLLAYFVVTAVMVLMLGNSTKDIDQSVRALLAIPILWLLLRVPVRLQILWAGVAIGVILSAGVAWWQIHVLQHDRASGFLNIIHFSNIALVFCVFCAAGLVWAATQGAQAWKWRVLFLVAITCGLYGVVQGGSRGSWVAAPAIAVLFVAAFVTRRNLARLAAVAVVGAAVVAALFIMPDSFLKVRYEAAVGDIQHYQQDNADTSIGARFEMWRGAMVNLQERPVQGWNHDLYVQALQRQIDDGSLSPVVLPFSDNLHNNVLQAWVFTGVPGLLALLALYAVPLWHFGRRLRDSDLVVRSLALCGTSLVLSYICFGLTQVILRRNNGIMFFLLTLVILWGALHHAVAARRHAQPVSGAKT